MYASPSELIGRSGQSRVVVNDHGGPDVDGPRNGEDHIWEARVLQKSGLNGWVQAAMAAQGVCVGIEQVCDGGGNVHTAEGLEEGVGGVLSHPIADECVSGVVVVAGELC